MAHWLERAVKNIMLRMTHGLLLLVRILSKFNKFFCIRISPNLRFPIHFSDMTFRRRNAGVVAHDGFLYVVGGDDGSSNLNNVEVYCPKTDTWRILPASMSIGRSYAGVCMIDKPM